MLTNKRATVILASLLMLITVGGALAQTAKTAHASIPFEFRIGGDRLPAGDYVIEHLDATSYLYIRSTNGRTAHGVYTLPVDDVPAKTEECKLIFEVRNGNWYLYGGWGPFGRRVIVAESTRPEPSGTERVEIPITFR